MSVFGAAILGCSGQTLTEDERQFFAETNPFGFILFSRNIADGDQLRGLCADLRASVGRDAPILIDQEGGRVQRLVPPLARDWAPPLDDVQRFGAYAEAAMRLRYNIIALELRQYGIDTNCAPLLDIARTETHAFLRNRCYGEDVDTVTRVGQAVVQGLRDGGIVPVIKHIPGHGLARADSHEEVPRVSTDPATLNAHDFSAFRPFASLPMGMTSHVIYECIDWAPATLSPAVIHVIRHTIGFTGLLMTDDISMGALSGPVAQRGEAAVRAGCDLVLHCNGDLDEMRALMTAVGGMRPDAQTRAEAALRARRAPRHVDIPALEAELEALTGRLL